jgi:uncharacterized protein YndB with AHSA1/START domain
MTRTFEALLEDSVEIAATSARVWALVSDVCGMAQWSPQVTSTRLRAGFDRVELGTQFTNRNAHGELVWTTHGEIVRFAEGRELAFRIEENYVIWSFTLEPTGAASTTLTQRREAPDGISHFSLDLTERYLGGQEAFTASMRAGMRQTLERLKAAAEG